MNNSFRILSFTEGLSLLILLFIAMPIKYIGGDPRMVKVVGMAHGILFLILVYRIFMDAAKESWPKKLLLIALVSSSIPFGMFLLDAKLKEFYKSKEAKTT